MRHIDDGYSYEFYEYTQDVIDYYRKRSDYDTDTDEMNYRERQDSVLENSGEPGCMTFSFGEF